MYQRKQRKSGIKLHQWENEIDVENSHLIIVLMQYKVKLDFWWKCKIFMTRQILCHISREISVKFDSTYQFHWKQIWISRLNIILISVSADVQ